MSEASLERRCRRVTKARGGVLLKFLPWLARGFPDRILLLPGGWIAFLEFKAAKGSLRKMQDWWMRKLTGLGFRWFEVRTYEDFEEILSLWSDRG